MQPANLLSIPTLSDAWSDNDNILLHACFHLLLDCVENEQLLTSRDWALEEAEQAKQEIETLAQWWKERLLLEKQAQLDPIWTKGQFERDNQMLVRLIQVRQYLWT